MINDYENMIVSNGYRLVNEISTFDHTTILIKINTIMVKRKPHNPKITKVNSRRIEDIGCIDDLVEVDNNTTSIKLRTR